MSKLNLKEASLLDASDELSPAARRALMARISGDSAAQQTFQTAHENLTLLSALPIPEPSAAERRSIPASIKKALHLALHQHEKQASAQANRPRMLVRYASSGIALAACLFVSVILVRAQSAHDAHLHDQAARINAQIDRVARFSVPLPDAAAPGVAQPRTSSDALNALAALPPDAQPAASEGEDADYSAPPGSY